jgi:hypothetical protein
MAAISGRVENIWFVMELTPVPPYIGFTAHVEKIEIANKV